MRFHLLAAHLEQGRRLSEALGDVPHLLPQQVRAMLKVGERIGSVAKVLPACRLGLQDGVSQVRGALNYLILLLFLAVPFLTLAPMVIKVKILPAFKSVFEGMLGGAQLPAFTRFVFDTNWVTFAIQTALLMLIWLATLAYLGGPRLQPWAARVIPGASDWVSYRLPWRRKRLQRDFSAMLATLLDAGVPETEALALAGQSTANTAIQRRVEKARGLLSKGVTLTQALSALDDSGELQWRLANALRGPGGFVRALAGWHEALDAKAFQLEQTAAQLATTSFVLLNGLIVGSIVIGMFLVLIQLINSASLW